MYVNSVRNSNVYSFKSNENSEVKDVKAEQPTEKASEIQNKSVNEDKFDKKEPSQAEVSAPINNESKPQNSAEAIMAQINKMQKLQQIQNLKNNRKLSFSSNLLREMLHQLVKFKEIF